MKIIWRRLLTNPTTHIESVEGEVVRLRINGLVCSSVCAVRAKQALRGIEGVRRVTVDFEQGIATIDGKPATPDAYQRAITGVVAGKPLRRLIERIARQLQPVSPDGIGGSRARVRRT